MNMKPETIKNNLLDAVSFVGDIYKEMETLRKRNAELLKQIEKDDEGDGDGNRNVPAFDCLAVTQVQVFPFKEGPSLGHLKGLALIVLNDQMVIRGLRIMDGINGLYVSYPLDPLYKGEEFKSICNPITRQLREHIENCVLEKYQSMID